MRGATGPRREPAAVDRWRTVTRPGPWTRRWRARSAAPRARRTPEERTRRAASSSRVSRCAADVPPRRRRSRLGARSSASERKQRARPARPPVAAKSSTSFDRPHRRRRCRPDGTPSVDRAAGAIDRMLRPTSATASRSHASPGVASRSRASRTRRRVQRAPSAIRMPPTSRQTSAGHRREGCRRCRSRAARREHPQSRESQHHPAGRCRSGERDVDLPRRLRQSTQHVGETRQRRRRAPRRIPSRSTTIAASARPRRSLRRRQRPPTVADEALRQIVGRVAAPSTTTLRRVGRVARGSVTPRRQGGDARSRQHRQPLHERWRPTQTRVMRPAAPSGDRACRARARPSAASRRPPAMRSTWSTRVERAHRLARHGIRPSGPASAPSASSRAGTSRERVGMQRSGSAVVTRVERAEQLAQLGSRGTPRRRDGRVASAGSRAPAGRARSRPRRRGWPGGPRAPPREGARCGARRRLRPPRCARVGGAVASSAASSVVLPLPPAPVIRRLARRATRSRTRRRADHAEEPRLHRDRRSVGGRDAREPESRAPRRPVTPAGARRGLGCRRRSARRHTASPRRRGGHPRRRVGRRGRAPRPGDSSASGSGRCPRRDPSTPCRRGSRRRRSPSGRRRARASTPNTAKSRPPDGSNALAQRTGHGSTAWRAPPADGSCPPNPWDPTHPSERGRAKRGAAPIGGNRRRHSNAGLGGIAGVANRDCARMNRVYSKRGTAQR